MSDELNATNVEEEEIDTLPNFVTIGDEEIIITPLTAKKTAFIMNVLGTLLMNGKMKLRELRNKDSSDLPFAILASVDEDTLIKLAATIVDRDVNFVKEHFELTWVFEALLVQTRVGELDKVIRNFTSLVSQIV